MQINAETISTPLAAAADKTTVSGRERVNCLQFRFVLSGTWWESLEELSLQSHNRVEPV